MTIKICDILTYPEMEQATVAAGKNQLERVIYNITDDVGNIQEGSLVILKNRWMNLEVLACEHPEAAGFVVGDTCLFDADKMEHPVLALPEEQLQNSSDLCNIRIVFPTLQLFEVLLENQGADIAEMLEMLKTAVKSDLFLLEQEKQTVRFMTAERMPKDLAERYEQLPAVTALINGEMLILRADMELVDQYLLRCIANALQAASAINCLNDRNAVAVRLIREGDRELSTRFAQECGMEFPKTADVWLLIGEKGASVHPWMKSIREFCSTFGAVYFLEEFEQDLVIVLEKPSSQKEEHSHAKALAEYCRRSNMPVTLIRGMELKDRHKTLKAVRGMAENTLKDAPRVYPCALYYTPHGLHLIYECQQAIQLACSTYYYYLEMLDQLGRSTGERELIDTLSSFFLDQNMSITETSAAMFVHRNTIKYRMQRAEDLLGLDTGNISDIYELVKALVIDRLIGEVPALKENQQKSA